MSLRAWAWSIVIAAFLWAAIILVGSPAPLLAAASPLPAVALDDRTAERRVWLLGQLVASATPTPASSGEIGWASWYDAGPGLYAAAGPLLRHGHWRGSTVVVTSGRRSIAVRLIDWCACGLRHGLPSLLDLSPAAFRALAPLSRGIVLVTLERPLPSTDR